MTLPTGTILDEIVTYKRIDLADQKKQQPLERVSALARSVAPARDFTAALRAPGISLIAEIKRASPSSGELARDLQPADLARTYVDNGAAACSVLTDTRFFQGQLADLESVRQAVSAPVLRKDFIIDPYQLYEARAAGADAVLLIVAILDDEALCGLQALAHDLGMAALVEVHSRQELDRALATDPRIIGVNNRNLHTFEVDLKTTESLRPYVPADVVLVTESGIHTPDDVARLRRIGVDAMLVGTALVTAADTAAAVRQLVQAGRLSL
ncbi:MAG: indole-3-glycerol phosphate synthase TrpC [Anaerolineae bacterium]|nr:indole-3-glycerol phosphate synthase TrpC [Anaerolineae bacterium]